MESTESPKPSASVVEQNGQVPTVQDPPISPPMSSPPKAFPVKRVVLFGGLGILAIAAAILGYRWGNLSLTIKKRMMRMLWLMFTPSMLEFQAL
jgi:hypothetical protein